MVLQLPVEISIFAALRGQGDRLIEVLFFFVLMNNVHLQEFVRLLVVYCSTTLRI